jgi:hypothetical protein
MARGKALGGFLFEDLFHLNLTSGAEFRFLNYHSIGVDYVYFRNRGEEESYDSTLMEYVDNGFNYFDKRIYALIDYRFYFNFFKKKPTRFLPYFNIITKFGLQTKWYQEGSWFKRTAPLYYKANFSEYGMAFGSHIILSEGKWGVDINIGAIHKSSGVIFEIDNDQSIINEHFITKGWSPHMRINLYVYLFNKIK